MCRKIVARGVQSRSYRAWSYERLIYSCWCQRNYSMTHLPELRTERHMNTHTFLWTPHEIKPKESANVCKICQFSHRPLLWDFLREICVKTGVLYLDIKFFRSLCMLCVSPSEVCFSCLCPLLLLAVWDMFRVQMHWAMVTTSMFFNVH